MLDESLAMPKNRGMDIIKELGPTKVSRLLGVKPPSVVEWRTRGIPPERCVALERATRGQYSCERLRPDVSWVRVADSAWPWHADGRPCVDFAGPSSGGVDVAAIPADIGTPAAAMSPNLSAPATGAAGA